MNDIFKLSKESKNEEIKQIISNSKFDFDTRDELGNTILHQAIISREDELADFILTFSKSSILNTQNLKGETSLHVAIIRSHRVVKSLVKAGANVNIKNNKGETALFYATRLEDSTIMELLIDNGADIDATTNYGVTALHEAANECFETTEAELLISKGADVNIKTNNGDTPVHFAACMGRTNMIQILLDAGTKASASNKAGQTAFDESLEKEHSSMLKILCNAEYKETGIDKTHLLKIKIQKENEFLKSFYEKKEKSLQATPLYSHNSAALNFQSRLNKDSTISISNHIKITNANYRSKTVLSNKTKCMIM